MTIRRDILADADGDMTLTAGRFVWAEDAAAIAQSIKMRLQFFLGEWFADESAGILDFTTVFVKAPNIAIVSERFRTEIINTPGVNDLLEFTATFNRSARQFNVSFRVDTDLGELTDTAAVTVEA